MEGSAFSGAKFLDPAMIIRQLGITVGSKIADFGCGSGYFSLPLAHSVGGDGLVTAVDILPQALETVESKARFEGLSNLETRRANLEGEKGSGLEEGKYDWVILKDMLFQNTDKVRILSEANRVLKMGGSMLVVEWTDPVGGIGPEASMRIKKEDLKEMLSSSGFPVQREIEAGKFHYAFVAQKQ
ncbi:MAG TPA: class I SAM-dependent methyltransferase [Candidatus Moranbacteria bacterium]|nr:class I SAM-dependent methyltransferase [Candidatus Moranbacteria bacterium]